MIDHRIVIRGESSRRPFCAVSHDERSVVWTRAPCSSPTQTVLTDYGNTITAQQDFNRLQT